MTKTVYTEAWWDDDDGLVVGMGTEFTEATRRKSSQLIIKYQIVFGKDWLEEMFLSGNLNRRYVLEYLRRAWLYMETFKKAIQDELIGYDTFTVGSNERFQFTLDADRSFADEFSVTDIQPLKDW